MAFPGGMDSTLLLAYSLKVLGAERALAITANFPTLLRRELADAQALAAELGARQLVIATKELTDVTLNLEAFRSGSLNDLLPRTSDQGPR